MQAFEDEFLLGGGAAAGVPVLGGAVVGVPDGAEGPVPKGGVVGEVMLRRDEMWLENKLKRKKTKKKGERKKRGGGSPSCPNSGGGDRGRAGRGG